MNKVRIGIVGIGAIAEATHVAYLTKHENVTVSAITDVNEKRVKEMADKYQVEHYFTDIDDLISKVYLDALIICTPNQTHMELAKKAAEVGIHVLIEKPIGTNLEDVSSYLELAKEKNVITMVGMTHRFRDDASILKEYTNQGTFGDIYYAKAKLFRRRGTPVGWFTDQALSGGGALMDIGVHALDLAWWLMGNPQVQSISGHTVTAFGNYETRYTSTWESKNKELNANRTFDVEDFGAGWIRFTNGAVLSLEIAWAMNGEQGEGISIELLGDQGGATLKPLTIYKEENGIISQSSPIFKETDPFQNEINHFIDCIKTRKTPMVDGEQGYEVLKMLQGIYESSEKQEEIKY